MKNPIIGWVRARLWRDNMNWIAIICGRPGTGKSYCALSLAEQISKKFTADNVCFSAREFLKLMDAVGTKRGGTYIIDEAGANWGARSFMTRESRDLSAVLQIIRDENFAIILTLPALAMLDKHGRMLAHTICETVGRPNRKEGFVKLKLKNTYFNPTAQKELKIYATYPRVVMDGEAYRVPYMRVFLPSKKLIRAYERKKSAFKRDLIKQTLADRDAKSKPKEPSKKSRVVALLEQGDMSITAIAREVGCTYNYVSKIRMELPGIHANA